MDIVDFLSIEKREQDIDTITFVTDHDTDRIDIVIFGMDDNFGLHARHSGDLLYRDDTFFDFRDDLTDDSFDVFFRWLRDIEHDTRWILGDLFEIDEEVFTDFVHPLRDLSLWWEDDWHSFDIEDDCISMDFDNFRSEEFTLLVLKLLEETFSLDTFEILFDRLSCCLDTNSRKGEFVRSDIDQHLFTDLCIISELTSLFDIDLDIFVFDDFHHFELTIDHDRSIIIDIDDDIGLLIVRVIFTKCRSDTHLHYIDHLIGVKFIIFYELANGSLDGFTVELHETRSEKVKMYKVGK